MDLTPAQTARLAAIEPRLPRPHTTITLPDGTRGLCWVDPRGAWDVVLSVSPDGGLCVAWDGAAYVAGPSEAPDRVLEAARAQLVARGVGAT